MKKINLTNTELQLLGYYLCHGFYLNRRNRTTKYYILLSDIKKIENFADYILTPFLFKGSENIYCAEVVNHKIIEIANQISNNLINEAKYFTVEEQKEILKGKQIK